MTEDFHGSNSLKMMLAMHFQYTSYLPITSVVAVHSASRHTCLVMDWLMDTIVHLMLSLAYTMIHSMLCGEGARLRVMSGVAAWVIWTVDVIGWAGKGSVSGGGRCWVEGTSLVNIVSVPACRKKVDWIWQKCKGELTQKTLDMTALPWTRSFGCKGA